MRTGRSLFVITITDNAELPKDPGNREIMVSCLDDRRVNARLPTRSLDYHEASRCLPKALEFIDQPTCLFEQHNFVGT